jgi:pyruvate formate lyase activating enzyme
MRNDDVRGVVFNLQHYSIHDGPGIRTTVFLMGCPLKCIWCQNPESQHVKPALFFNQEICTGCGTCLWVCPEKVIRLFEGISKTDRTRCAGHGKCVEACPNEARSLMGREMSALEVFEDVRADAIFYKGSGGGVTLSGGDPIVQPTFATGILKLCREAGFHTAMETCGFAKWEILEGILKHTDLVLYDIKHMESASHKELTGVPNELILENARKIHQELKLPMLARIPIIPGYNDSQENLETTARFIKHDLGSPKVYLLPYHRLGEVKYHRMEQPDKITEIDPPGEDDMASLVKIFESEGLKAVIGG